ncbi:LPXTG cell wall anchor domain-containing protein [Saccharothrix sp. S26]|uniref:LPXTG cell wall anchor domain-containing protein n=1 Tax=Saccharothrix sp. S26 TaxID=2907215 RepID=UPI001F424C8B|nr:LPXTG cell wall anchor domain-containing protein [Saccharothrix sp. S26]MCE6993424.1 LPXTG cell wall anchor domain-containing protein [Saccharothrix sp. S26]
MIVVVCLALGLVVAPGVASADTPWHVPDGWGEDVRGDVCKFRGEPPCHTTTTNAPTTTKATTTTTAPVTTSTGGWSTSVTTTTGVSGTSATATTTTTTGVAGTTTASTTTSAVTTSTAATTTSAARATTSSAGPRVMSANAQRGLASTGAAPLWIGVGGLVALLAGAVLLLFSRRRRA